MLISTQSLHHWSSRSDIVSSLSLLYMLHSRCEVLIASFLTIFEPLSARIRPLVPSTSHLDHKMPQAGKGGAFKADIPKQKQELHG